MSAMQASCTCGHKKRSHISYGRRACVVCTCAEFNLHKRRSNLGPRWLAYAVKPDARPGFLSIWRDIRFLLFVFWLVIRREIILDRQV